MRDLTTYPEWWPEVRKVEVLDFDRAEVSITALLPYSLSLVMVREVEDPVAGVLKASMSGDLRGSSSWKLSADGNGCNLLFVEEVEATKRLLRLLAPVARPAFTLNHSIMMRRGELGLRRYLSGRR